MSKPTAPIDDNPEWIAEDFAKAKPASKTEPAHVVKALVRKRGRPAGSTKADSKYQVALRIDRDLVDAAKAGGRGWQTKMNTALRPRIDVTYLAAVKRWLVTIVRPLEDQPGRSHQIVNAFDDKEAATAQAHALAAREKVKPEVKVWPQV